MKDFDVNVSPLEHAEIVRKKVVAVSPSRLYTYRYIWKRDDRESLSVSIFSGTVADHDRFRKTLIEDEHVISATAEYVSEVDVNFLMLVETIKKEKEVFKNEESVD